MSAVIFAVTALLLLVCGKILIKCVSERPWAMIDSHVNSNGTEIFNMVLQ